MPPKKTNRRNTNTGPGAPNTAPTTDQPLSATSKPRAATRQPRPNPAARHSVPLKPADGEESPANICSICAERARDWAVGRCPHVVCGDCSHRLRVLYDRRACVMCSANLKQVAVVPLRDYRAGMTFDDAVALPGTFQDKQVEMWFVERARCQQLKNVRGWMCSHRACAGGGSVFSNATQLRAHARTEHRGVYCEVCWGGRKCFVSEMAMFTMDAGRNYSSRLKGHLRKEHPRCRFCGHYYLDDEKLYAHLQEKHETCSICERNGRMHEYFVNYEQLENHYRHDHYVCRDQGCRGVVFATHIELQTHEHTHHNENSRNVRGRSLRVNLQQLHGDRDTQRRDISSARAVQVEQERQAARRRAFLSSNVVFSGALNDDDAAAASASGSGSHEGDASQPYSSSEARNSSSGAAPLPVSGGASASARRPDDGKFYPLELPRDGEEMKARNTMLVRSMRSILDPAAYEQFRMSSAQFHSGKIDAEQYYEAVIDAFGVRAAIRDILPELVALLPTPLLREPLLRTCMQRTDTKPSNIGYLGPPSTDAASESSSGGRARVQDEQFPTLNGAAPPVRAPPQSMRRFGTPGPEEFPRLGRVNKPQGGPSAGPSSASAAPSTRRGHATPSESSGASATRAQETAASILRQPPRSVHIANRRGAASASRASPSIGDQLSASAFPSLSPSVASGSSVPPTQESADNRAEGNGNGAPSSDVSMRVGAVWGGAASRAYGRGGRKRGPGRWQGQQSESSPMRPALGSTDFPDIRVNSQTDDSPSTTNVHGSGNGSQNAVIDVMQIAKARKGATLKSSLPKVGGSGYGFAWDRKKVQQKKKQIKSSVIQNDVERSSTPWPGNSEQATPNYESEESSGANLDEGVTAGIVELNSDAEGLTNGLAEVNLADSVVPAPESAKESQEFDPYSYLKRDTTTKSAAASFFES